MAGIRSFVAVELDETARREMARLEDLLRPAGADVKWVLPENLHLTLKFLGNVPEERLDEVAGALAGALEGAGAFSISLAGLGAFPSLSRPHVVWVGVGEGRERVASLAARIDAALEPVGFARESREFSPHLTLGRCRSPRNAAALAAAIRERASYKGPGVNINRVVLFSSVLRPTGPVYRPLTGFKLQVGGPTRGGGL